MNNYFGYIRVSTARQGERGVSLQEQRDAIARYAARFDLSITEWFEEQQTAAKRGRPIWNRMLKSLRRGVAHGVVIHKIDRSARNLKDWADLGDLMDQGIEVHFANESLDLRSRGGRLSADIQAVVAADYVRNLREEAKKGIYGRLKQGFYPMRAPLGYVDNGAGKPKTIHPITGPLVRRAFELYASGRFTIVPLTDELYRLGLRNRQGGRVTRNGLAVILNNPFYTGLMRIRRTGTVFAGNHEPLVSTRLFKAVQNALNGRFNGRTIVHEFLFRRLVTCKRCGYSLIGESKKGHTYYRCHTRDCPTTGVREERVQELVHVAVRRLSFTAQEREYLRLRTEELKVDWLATQESQSKALNIRLEQVTERLQRLTDAFLDGAIDRQLFEDRKIALTIERRGIEDQLRFMKENPASAAELVQKFLELAGDVNLLYKSAASEKKRHLVKIISSNLSLNEKTLEFTYAPPFREIAERAISSHGGPSKGLHRTCDTLIDSLLSTIDECRPLLVAYETNDQYE